MNKLLFVVCLLTAYIFQPSTGSSISEISDEDANKLRGAAAACFRTNNKPCTLPVNGGVCANGLQLCLNNACPVGSGFELFMDSYREALPAAAGLKSSNEDYEPLVCFIGRECACDLFVLNTGLGVNVCVRSSAPPNFWSPQIFESYATGVSCPTSAPY